MPISSNRPDIRLISEGIPDLLPMLDRSPGIHLSEIINDICLRLGHYKGDSQVNMTRMQLGCALEDSLIRRYALNYPEQFIQPGEVTVNGIHITPDLLYVTDHAPEECKLTWMSAKNGPQSEKLWRYWAQLAAQCVGVGADIARLNVTFVNGDYYKGGSAPINRVWERRYTKKELDDNWTMLLRHRDKMERGE